MSLHNSATDYDTISGFTSYKDYKVRQSNVNLEVLSAVRLIYLILHRFPQACQSDTEYSAQPQM